MDLPYLGQLQLKEIIRQGMKIRIIYPGGLKEDEETMYVAYYGAPLIMIEKIPFGSKVILSAEQMIAETKLKGRKVSALIAMEIGGLNSMIPLYTASMMNMPFVDSDFMGRAVYFYK